MSQKKEIVICPGDEIVHSGKFLSQAVRTYKDTDGRLGKYELTVRTNVTNIVAGLPVTSAGDFLINRQFRIPLGQKVFENTAGLVDEGETLEEAIIRELREETGYVSGELRHVCRVPTSSGLTDELIDCFILLNAQKAGEPNLESSESIDTFLIADNEIDEWFFEQVRSGNLVDPKVMMLVSYYRRWIKSI